MKLYKKICDTLEYELDDFFIDEISDDYEGSYLKYQNKNYISTSYNLKLTAKLINRLEKLNIKEDILNSIKYDFRCWFLEQTREYLLINDYTPENEDEKIDDILQLDYYSICTEKSVLDIPEMIKNNYEAIEAFHCCTVSYVEMFERENYPNFIINSEIFFKKDNINPFICVLNCNAGEIIREENSMRMALTRNKPPQTMKEFYNIVNKTFKKAFPHLTKLPF